MNIKLNKTETRIRNMNCKFADCGEIAVLVP